MDVKRLLGRLCGYVLAIGLIGLAPTGARAIVIEYDIVDANLTVGEDLVVDVVVSDIAPGNLVIGFGFDVLSTLLGLPSALVGPGFDFDVSAPPAPPASINVAGASVLGVDPAGGDVLLATLSFATTTAGLFTFDLEIVSDLADLTQGLILFPSPISEDLDYSDQITVNVMAASPVPEPATVALLALGIALAGFRRRAGA